GEKVGMTQVWDDQNRAIPVTVVKVAPCRVVMVKTLDHDGYSALQVTYGQVKESRLTKPEAGHFAKAGVAAGRRLVELRVDEVGEADAERELVLIKGAVPGPRGGVILIRYALKGQA